MSGPLPLSSPSIQSYTLRSRLLRDPITQCHPQIRSEPLPLRLHRRHGQSPCSRPLKRGSTTYCLSKRDETPYGTATCSSQHCLLLRARRQGRECQREVDRRAVVAGGAAARVRAVSFSRQGSTSTSWRRVGTRCWRKCRKWRLLQGFRLGIHDPNVSHSLAIVSRPACPWSLVGSRCPHIVRVPVLLSLPSIPLLHNV